MFIKKSIILLQVKFGQMNTRNAPFRFRHVMISQKNMVVTLGKMLKLRVTTAENTDASTGGIFLAENRPLGLFSQGLKSIILIQKLMVTKPELKILSLLVNDAIGQKGLNQFPGFSRIFARSREGSRLKGREWNGMEWNGMEWNGMEWNGMERI